MQRKKPLLRGSDVATYTLSGQPISRATLRIPRYGIWTAEVELQATPVPALSAGTSVVLALGDLSLTGTLLPGGTFGGTASFGVIGGAGTWDATLSSRTYRDDNGVLLSKVISDLAADAGEVGAVLDGVADRSLGYAWTRPAGTASDLLRALVGDAWWIATVGTTHAGPRPATSASPTDLSVEMYDPALRRAEVALSDDAVTQFLPGATVTADGLPAPLQVGQLDVRATASSVTVVLWGERTGPELAGAIMEALAGRSRYAASYPFQVTDTSGTRATVEPSDARSADLHGHPFLDSVYGLPGASATLQQGQGVLVAWPGMDPGSPMIVGWLPNILPLTLILNALTSITLGGSAAVPAAKSDKTDAAISALLTGVNAALAALSLTPVAPPGSTAATKVMVE
jgi:hypothetical protein